MAEAVTWRNKHFFFLERSKDIYKRIFFGRGQGII